MTYAHREDIYDADTHMMEHPNWIRDFADKDIKNHLEPIVEGDKEVLERIELAIENFNLRQRDPLKLNKAKDEFMGWKHKGWEGLGAFNAEERKLANDLTVLQPLLLRWSISTMLRYTTFSHRMTFI